MPVALPVACASLFLPQAVSLSAYASLHFALQSIHRAANRIRSRFDASGAYDAADHTLHLVSASAGAAYAFCVRPLPDVAHLMRLGALWLLLAARVSSHRFPL